MCRVSVFRLPEWYTATMKIEQRNPKELKHYKLNAKKHPDSQVAGLAESIKKFGFIQPVVLDGKDEIIIGHGRTMAAIRAGLDTIPTVKLENLTEQEVKALRLIDNRIAETGYDIDLLKMDLDTLDFDLEPFKIDFDDCFQDKSAKKTDYTRKISSPIYEIKGKQPSIKELFDEQKYQNLKTEIEASTFLNESEKHLLLMAATRHIRFNFEMIAEFYAHASKEVQQLMENSALVVIDYDKAIELGFAKLISDLINED